MTEERWAAVPGYEGLYEVSDRGRVRSFYDGSGHQVAARPQRVLKMTENPGGFLWVGLHRNGERRTTMVHRLVAKAFLGPAPAGCYVVHQNGNRHDNRAENLRYGRRRRPAPVRAWEW